MKLSKLLAIIVLNLCAVTGTFAAEQPPVEVTGTSPAVVQENPKYIFRVARGADKPILLEQIVLSPAAKEQMLENIEEAIDTPIIKNTNTPGLPDQITLGMANVPVLDQGPFGTCATFATTAAIDAAAGKGDYISQLCNLSLGDYLKQNHLALASGWDGTWNFFVFKQIKKYGIITKQYQQDANTDGCAGIKKYPTHAKDPIRPFPIQEFTAHSEMMMTSMSTKSLLHHRDALTKKIDMDTVLANVKLALLNQHRVVIGFLLDTTDHSAGNEGTLNTERDSWILTPSILKNFENKMIVDGHAIVVTGYNDNAVISGPNDTKHVGALILRNSWSTNAGDNGDYYMSYDYFKALGLEAIELVPN